MSSTVPSGTPQYRPVPGPVERDTFFAVQARHRRAASWLSVLAALTVVLLGFPLATILFPLLFGIAALVSLPVARVLQVPDLAGMLLDGHGIAGLDAAGPAGWLGVGIIVCLPGSIAMLWLWRRVSAVLTGSDLSAILDHLGARAPRTDDAEERQLRNVAEEIAIAAGLPAPRVMLLDNASINVAALGATAQSATLVVTRGLLDGCNRDETQALVADAIASIGNGDLRATLRWISVSLTLTIVRLLLQAPYWPVARQRLAGLRTLFWRDAAASGAVDVAAVSALLGDLPEPPGELTGGRMRLALTFPFFMAHAMFNAVGWFTSLLFLSPALSLLLRRRRYLADAIAVQLTRYPDALASALGRTITQPRAPRTMTRLMKLLFIVAPPDEFADDQAPVGFFFDTHPSPGKRHQRVARMGLIAQGADPSRFAALLALPRGPRLLASGLLALIVPLAGAAIYLMLYLIVALTGFSLAVGMIYVLVVLMPIRWLLGA